MQGWAALTLKEFESEWREALLLSSQAHAATAPADDRTSVGDGAEEADPFDCSCAVVPSLHELVEETALKRVREWKALDERKINAAAAPTHEELRGPAPAKKKNRVAMRQDTGMPLWYDHPNRIRLPHRFDYLCRHPTAEVAAAAAAASVETEASAAAPALPGSNDDPTVEQGSLPVPDEPRVQSLVDPTLTTSYHAELWNLFSRIASAEQLRRHTCDHDDDDDVNSADSDSSGSPDEATPLPLRRMRKLSSWYSTSSYLSSQQQRQPKRQDQPSAAEDAMCLWTRLRVPDRHEPPLPLTSASSPSPRRDPPATKLLTSVRFECWRGCASPSLSILPDPNRLSVEFLKSHTLLDFHRVLVEQARDDLWTKLEASAGDETKSDETGSTDAGFFFFEDTFYITGPTAVEYVNPLLAWLAEKKLVGGDSDDSSTGGQDRLARLGVPVASVDDLNIVQMSEARLEDLSLRLGSRYAHVHHGNVECSVYCVDRRVQIVQSSDCSASWVRMYPILHDVWTSAYTTPSCEACQHRTASLVSTPTCEVTDGGPRPLCRRCARLLQVPASELEVYSIYRAG